MITVHAACLLDTIALMPSHAKESMLPAVQCSHVLNIMSYVVQALLHFPR